MGNGSERIKAEAIAFLRLFKLMGELQEAKNPLATELGTIVQDQRQIFHVTSARTELDELTGTLHDGMTHEFNSKMAGANAAIDYLRKNFPDLYKRMQSYTESELFPKPFGHS